MNTATSIDVSGIITMLQGLLTVSEMVQIFGSILAVTVVFTITRRLIIKFSEMFEGAITGTKKRR